MKSVNSLINTIKNHISNNDSVKKIEEATNKILHKEDKEVSCCNDTDNKNTEKIDELNKIKIIQPSSSSIFNRSDDIYHLFRPQDNINSYDSSLIMRNVDKCKGTNENLKNSKRIQLYKNKGDISNFNTTIRTNLNKFKIDLSKDLRYKFLNKYSAKDDFNFDIYIFPPPAGVIPDGYSQEINLADADVDFYYTPDVYNPNAVKKINVDKNKLYYIKYLRYYERENKSYGWTTYEFHDVYDEINYDIRTGNTMHTQLDVQRIGKKNGPNAFCFSLVKTSDKDKFINFIKKYGASDIIPEPSAFSEEYTSIMFRPNGKYYH